MGRTALGCCVLLLSAAACGPAVRPGGRYGNDVMLDSFGGPPASGRVHKCPRGTSGGSIQLSWDSGHKRIKGSMQGRGDAC